MLRKFLAIALTVFFCTAGQTLAAPRVDIYGPGQNVVNLGLAAPITGPNTEARQMGAQLQKLVNENLSFLPFMRLTDPKTVLGGTVLAGVEPPQADFKRFQLAGSDIVVTTLWPNGDRGTTRVQMRAYETSGGARLFGKEYPSVSSRDLPEVADRFCADLLEALTGNGAFFRCKNINLGYTFPSKWIKKAGIESLGIYINVDDPFCIDNYPKGWDPEASVNTYITTTYTLGLDIKF